MKTYSRIPLLLPFALAIPLSLAGQTEVTVPRTAGGTVTANTLVADSGTTGTVATAGGTGTTPVGNCTGVVLGSVASGAQVQVAQYGLANVLMSTTPTPTVGDLVICPTTGSTGYGIDAGTTLTSSVELGTQVVGRILSTGTGSGPALVQLFGPGVTGSGWIPLVLGFQQYLASSYMGAGADSYTYKMCAPSNPLAGVPCSATPLVPTNDTGSSYAGWWIDRGGFGSTGGTTAVAPNDYELLRLSAVTQAGMRENTLEIFDFTTTGKGSVPASFFNEAGTDGYLTGLPLMYGINTHTAGCAATKCGSTGSPRDYDIQQIGMESDVEERSAYSQAGHTSGKQSAPSYGVFSVCVNCNNSGMNTAFEAAAKKALGSDIANNMPWGFGFQSSPGAATTGVDIEPLAGTGPSDSQPLKQCAYTNSSNSLSCASIQTLAAGHTQFVNSTTTTYTLAPLSFAYPQNNLTAGTQTLASTDLGAYWTNAAATGIVKFILPTPAGGAVVYFAQTSSTLSLTIQAPGTTPMCYAPAAPACNAGGSIVTTQKGALAKLVGIAGSWFVEYETGSWTGP